MGAGTDTIVLADTTISSTTTALNAAIVATGAEVIGFSAAGTSVDMSAVAATQVASYQTGNGNLTFTKLLATDTVIITQGVSADADVIVTGQLGFTTANVTLQGSATAGVSIDDLTAQTLATVQINSAGGSAAVNTLDNLVLSDNAVVTVTGTQGLTITRALANTAVVLDGSAMTGVLTVTGGTAASSLVGGAGNDVITGGTGADTLVGGAGNDTLNSGVDVANANTVIGGLGADTINLQNDTTAAATYGVSATAAQSYATTGQFDTVNNAAIADTDSSVITLTTGLLNATVVGAASVSIGTTTVAAGSFLAVGSTNGTLTATSQNFQIYQDSNSNGIIDATDLRVDFNKTGNDTLAVTIVGSKIVVTVGGVA
jgi:S-layer protein